MGTVSSSTGLISGFDTANIVKQLMEIEARPLTLLKNRVQSVNAEKLAYQSINALLLSALSSAGTLADSKTFSTRTATSSSPDVLGATASSTAAAGSYSFLVRSIVSTHQLASAGFADRNSTPVGAGTLTFESAAARVQTDTELSALNGGQGVRRGQIRITDRSGASTTVDLRSAYTVGDVLDAVNSQSVAAVRAYVKQDRIVIEDVTGLPAGQGQLSVADVGTGRLAADLGIAGNDAGTGKIVSAADLIRLTGSTALASLNDGLGVRLKGDGAELRFTLANDRVFDIDLSERFAFDTSLGEVNGGQGVGAGTIRITNREGVTQTLTLTGRETVSEINTILTSDPYKDLQVKFTSTTGSGSLTLTDNSGGSGKFKVEDVSGAIATQLKLAGEVEGTSITGKVNYSLSTVDSLIRKIQYARDTSGSTNGGDFELAISADGKGLTVIDRTTGGSTSSVVALNGANTLQDLGLTGTFENGTLASSRLVSGLNTVLLRNLNGGAGVRLGIARFSMRDGSTQTVDFTGAKTLEDVIGRINETGSLKAEIASGGTGLILTDPTSGTGTFSGEGDTLADLQIPASSGDGRLVGGDLDRKYVSEATLLSRLNGGKGIGLTADDSSSTVKFQITNSAGLTATVTLSGSAHRTVGDVIDAINNAMTDKGVRARVNADGDGLELYETGAPGSGRLAVAEVGTGGAAAALGIKGQASASQPGVLTGTLASRIEIAASDTLETVMNKINSAGVNARASIVNDGSASRPYRLIVTSGSTGTAGELAFNTGQTGLSFETLTEAQDARVVVGNIDSTSSILINSSSNQITGVVQGLTLNLAAPSNTAVQVTVAQNIESVSSAVEGFVKSYNSIFDRIDEYTAYNAETEKKGVLLGDSAVTQIRDRLYRQVSRTLSGDYTLRRLSNVGITFSQDSGGRLELNKDALTQAITADPEAVKTLFTKVTTTTDAAGKETVQYVGIGASLKQALRDLTNSTTGLLGLQISRLDDRAELYNNRIDDMQVLLDKKEARYYSQFQAMEEALASLQSQQSALTNLSSLVSSMSSTKKS